MGDEMLGLIFRAVNSVVLAKYYAVFLPPKSKGTLRRLVYAGFGITYFIVQYLMTYSLLSVGIGASPGMPELVFTFCALIILMSAVGLLSHIFFIGDLGLKIFLLCSFFAVQEICYYISSCLFNISLMYRLPLFADFAHIGTYTAMFYLSLQSIIRNFPHKKQSFAPMELLYLILPCLSGLTLVSIIKVMPYKIVVGGQLEVAAKVPFYNFLTPLSGFVFLIGLTASVKLFQKLAELHAEESERMIFNKQARQLQEQIRDVNSIYSEIRGARHDMKNHVSNIRLLVSALIEGRPGVDDELEKYLGKLGDALDRFDFAFQTGNPITDVIIHQKHLEAVNEGVEFSAEFIYPARLGLDVYDLAVILNNALENAIEACGGLPSEGRFIRLYSYMRNGMFFIEIENSFTGEITVDKHTHLPLSGKPDRSEHGMGIANILRCAKKYYGDIDWQASKDKGRNTFLLTVMLQGRE